MKKFLKYIIGIIILITIYFFIINFNYLFYNIAMYQQILIEKINNLIENKNSELIFSILILTFLYGIIHSLGPGHGKTLIITYSIKEKLNFTKIFLASFIIAYLQGLSAYFIIKSIIKLSDKSSMILFYDLDNKTRLITSILIIIIGAYNFYSILKNKYCEANYKTNLKNLLTFSIVLGLCPCPGVMTVLLFLESFGFSQNLFLSTLSISTGMFLIIFLFGITTNIFKKNLIDEKNSKIHNVLSIVGSIFIILFGILQILILCQ